MKSIGTKLTMSTAGAFVPATRAIEPRTAAIVHAGAVESTPIATPSQKPTAPSLSRFDGCWPGTVLVARGQPSARALSCRSPFSKSLPRRLPMRITAKRTFMRMFC